MNPGARIHFSRSGGMYYITNPPLVPNCWLSIDTYIKPTKLEKYECNKIYSDLRNGIYYLRKCLYFMYSVPPPFTSNIPIQKCEPLFVDYAIAMDWTEELGSIKQDTIELLKRLRLKYLQAKHHF